jgi:hypothetical protein
MLIRILANCMKDQLGGVKPQLGPLNVLCWPSVSSSPHVWLVWLVERAIYVYWVLVTHWFSLHHHLHHQQHHLPSSSYSEKHTLTLACSLFSTRSFGFQKLFTNSPLCVLATSHTFQPPTWPSGEASDLSGFHWASLVWVPLTAYPEIPPPVWLAWVPSDLNGLNLDSTFGFLQISPWESF